MTARGSSMVLRIALIYCLLDQWCSTTKDVSISVKHLDAAMAVWRYCEFSAQQLFSGQGGDPLVDKLLALLSSGAMTKNDINRHLSPKQKDLVEETLDGMRRWGQVRRSIVKHPGPGRPATRWELIPQG